MLSRNGEHRNSDRRNNERPDSDTEHTMSIQNVVAPKNESMRLHGETKKKGVSVGV